VAVSIGEFLNELGLDRYLDAFAAADVDFETLADLTDSDLQALGMTLGHRKKLLRAIGSLAPVTKDRKRATSGRTVAPEENPVATEESQPERRQISILFCDLVGSTSLAERLDPEDLREVMRTYQMCCVQVVERFGGSITQVQGDGIMARFGYPVAHEDDAESAVACGLELVAAVPKLGVGEGLTLRARIGVATGSVVVGDRLAGTLEQGTSGTAPNLAARLQTIAEPDQVVVDALTMQLIGGVFDAIWLGRLDLKGFAEPVAVWKVGGIRKSNTRFAARHLEAPVEMVGRDHELGLLLHRWQEAASGEGQVVLLSAEAGYGKSRLLAALLAKLPERVIVQTWQCSPHRTNTAFFPAIDSLTAAANLLPDDSPSLALVKVTKLLEQPEQVKIIADLLAIPGEDNVGTLPLETPAEHKQRAFSALLSILLRNTERGPLVLAIEDAHWLDPTSAELVNLVIDRIQPLPVLLIVTFRPEFTPPWSSRGHMTTLTLNRLSRADSLRLAKLVAKSDELVPALADRIVDRADGVPLFVEELTRATIESSRQEASVEGGRTRATNGELVPSSLQSSLIARLDRLSAVKEITQIAAVIGREFSYALLAAVSGYDASTLERAVEQLCGAGILQERLGGGARTYAFKHTLIQDAACASLLRTKRCLFHHRIAETLEASFPQRCANEPEVIALHLSEAGETLRAVQYWSRAAKQALLKAANRETVAHATRGLDLLARLPSSPERDHLEQQLLATKLPAATFVYGFTAPEVVGLHERLRALYSPNHDPSHLNIAFFGEAITSFFRGQVARARDVADAWVTCIADEPIRSMYYHAVRCRLYASIIQADLEAARLDDAVTVASYSDEALSFGYGGYGGYAAINPRGVSDIYRALLLWTAGFPDQAEAAIHSAERVAMGEQTSSLSGIRLHTWATLILFQNDLPLLERVAQELEVIGHEHGIRLYDGTSVVLQGIIAVESGHYARGCKLIDDGHRVLADSAMYIMRPHQMIWSAIGRAETDGYEAGQRMLDEAIELAQETGQNLFLPVITTAKGKIYLKQGDVDAAWNAFLRAFHIAEKLGTRMFRLQAATELARIGGRIAHYGAGREMLESVLEGFSEGFRTKELVEAYNVLSAQASIHIVPCNAPEGT